MIETIIKTKYVQVTVSVLFLLILFFGRSFMGIYLFGGLRIGEYVMAAALVMYIYGLVISKRYFTNNKLEKKFIVVNVLIFMFFIINAVLSGSSFMNSYTYRTSSYLWAIGFYFLGYIFFKFNQLNSKYIIFLVFSLVYLYFFSIFGLPDTVILFIRSISDKFEPHKGADLLIIFSSIFFIANRYFPNKRVCLEVFISFTMLYFPLFLFKSRGAFIGFVFFVIFEIFYLRKSIKNTVSRNIIFIFISLLLLFQSIFLINGSAFIKLQDTEESVKFITEYRADPDDEEFRLLFLEEDYWTKEMRIKSTDNNLNWRLQIWQDVYFDIHYKKLYFTGYGYKYKIPAMELETRQGLDKLNENVHNYFVNLYARGGLIHISLYTAFFILLARLLKFKTESNALLPFILACLFAAFFDVAMENSHFPLIFYFMIGMYMNKKALFKYS